MPVQWNALNNMPNPGMATIQAFEGAQQRKQHGQMQHMQMQGQMEDRQLRRDQMQAEQAQAAIAQNREKIVTGAKIFRQMKAQNPNLPDEQVYQMTLPALQQAGIDVSTLPPPGSPEVGQFLGNAMAIADAFEKETADPSRIREFEIGKQRGHIPPNVTYEQFLSAVQPAGQAPIVQPWNAQPMGGGAPPPVLSDDDILRMEGGSGGNAGGGFL